MSRIPARSPSSDGPPVVGNSSLLFSALTCDVGSDGLLSGGKSPSCTAGYWFFAFITVAKPALKDHLKHGDTEGPWPELVT